MPLLMQAIWAIALLFATWVCFEGSRYDRTSMRLLAFLAVCIGVLHGCHELVQLAEVASGYPISRATGYEVVVPFLLAILKYFPLMRRAHG